MLYRSTRSDAPAVSSARAILTGMAPDGGLYVPEEIPALPCSWRELMQMDYQDAAFQVMRVFFTDFSDDELRACIHAAYDDTFEDDCVLQMKTIENKIFLELYHGPTLAFKDIALQILPHLLTMARDKEGDGSRTVILTATSGDTGKAAMEGFADVEGTKIIVFYPEKGVGTLQKRQMVTQTGGNVSVVAVDGDFDDCQSGVKAIFGDRALEDELAEAHISLSSANSINIGRLVPQIVYYIYAYACLLDFGDLKEGEKVNIAVPTGNFGDILAAYYAARMGLPVGRLICASNENNVLTDFFTSGTYDRNRPLYQTESPSMDILVSSNLERLLYEVCNRDSSRCAAYMKELSQKGCFTITEAERDKMSHFWAGYATEEEAREQIRETQSKYAYLLDPHTAVARAVCEKYEGETSDHIRTFIASTASPYKFPQTILKALGCDGTDRAMKAPETDEDREGAELADAFACVDQLEERSFFPAPQAVRNLKDAEVLHTLRCEPGEMRQMVREILKLL